MDVICILCNLEWNASKYTIKSTYICPHCDWKIKHNEKIKLEKRWKRGRMQRLLLQH